jgi:hypothetical protein
VKANFISFLQPNHNRLVHPQPANCMRQHAQMGSALANKQCVMGNLIVLMALMNWDAVSSSIWWNWNNLVHYLFGNSFIYLFVFGRNVIYEYNKWSEEGGVLCNKELYDYYISDHVMVFELMWLWCSDYVVWMGGIFGRHLRESDKLEYDKECGGCYCN